MSFFCLSNLFPLISCEVFKGDLPLRYSSNSDKSSFKKLYIQDYIQFKKSNPGNIMCILYIISINNNDNYISVASVKK